MPKSSAESGTRSSTPWNMPGKSIAGRQLQRRETVARYPELRQRLVVGAAATSGRAAPARRGRGGRARRPSRRRAVPRSGSRARCRCARARCRCPGRSDRGSRRARPPPRPARAARRSARSRCRARRCACTRRAARSGWSVVRSVARMKPAAVPDASTTASGPAAAGSTPSMRPSSSTSALVVSVRRIGHSRRPSATTASASFVTAFSRTSREPWDAGPRAMSRIQTRAFSPVCSRYARRAVEVDRVAADLADRLAGAVEDLGMAVDYPVGAEHPTGLLVGEEAHHEVARRPSPANRRISPSDASIIASMSFMSTAPRPQSMPSLTTPPKGSTVQFAGSAGTTSRVPVHDERRAGVRALDSSDDGQPSRLRLEVGRREPEPLELGAAVLRRLGLAVAPPFSPVDAREADEVAGEDGGAAELVGHPVNATHTESRRSGRDGPAARMKREQLTGLP